mmetsp:Transcript_50675/g.130690  ORF Transcript_50675/g.130690 Transcript_50675/m.130690 type:complete len:349 (-) Transcript_50675:4-1050(-)
MGARWTLFTLTLCLFLYLSVVSAPTWLGLSADMTDMSCSRSPASVGCFFPLLCSARTSAVSLPSSGWTSAISCCIFSCSFLLFSLFSCTSLSCSALSSTSDLVTAPFFSSISSWRRLSASLSSFSLSFSSLSLLSRSYPCSSWAGVGWKGEGWKGAKESGRVSAILPNIFGAKSRWGTPCLCTCDCDGRMSILLSCCCSGATCMCDDEVWARCDCLAATHASSLSASYRCLSGAIEEGRQASDGKGCCVLRWRCEGGIDSNSSTLNGRCPAPLDCCLLCALLSSSSMPFRCAMKSSCTLPISPVWCATERRGLRALELSPGTLHDAASTTSSHPIFSPFSSSARTLPH